MFKKARLTILYEQLSETNSVHRIRINNGFTSILQNQALVICRMGQKKTLNEIARKINSPQVYTVFKYIRELGRHGLPNVDESADMVHRRRPWHNCITVSVANDTKQATRKKKVRNRKERRDVKPLD